MEQVRVKRKMAGRPAKAVKRAVRVCIRLSTPEYFIVKEKARETGYKVSGYLREISLEATIVPRITDEERQMIRQLVSMGNNLNQIAKTCHQEGALRAMHYFEAYRNQIDAILKKLRA